MKQFDDEKNYTMNRVYDEPSGFDISQYFIKNESTRFIVNSVHRIIFSSYTQFIVYLVNRMLDSSFLIIYLYGLKINKIPR